MEHQRVELVHELIAGGAAGAIASIVIAPLDHVKLLKQYDYEGVWKQRTVASILSQIRQERGYIGWYRGLIPSLVGYVLSWAIYFMSYNSLKDILDNRADSESHSLISVIIPSLCAGFLSHTITSPIWVVHTRAVIGKLESTAAIIAEIFQKEGFRAFFSGLLPSYIGLIHVMIQFPLYEKLKAESLTKSIFEKEYAWLDTLYCSITSKIVASFITYPHEVLRTRQRIIKTENGDFYGLLELTQKIFHEEGLLGFYKGMGVTLVRVIPYTGLVFTFHAVFKKALVQM